RFPGQFRQTLFTLGTYESRFRPIGPIAAITVTAIGNDKMQLLGAANIGVDCHRVAGSLACYRFAGKYGPRSPPACAAASAAILALRSLVCVRCIGRIVGWQVQPRA